MRKYDIPTDLIKAAKNGNLVLFVGSGVSQNLKNLKGEKLGDWNDMVKLISDILTKRGIDNITYAPYLGNNPAKALEEIEKMENIPYADIRSALRYYYKVSNENDFKLHRKLLKLSSKIITLNYDDAFEKCINDDIPIAYRRNNYEISEVIKKERWLFKLHGSTNSADSMIVFPSDYKRLYERNTEDDSSDSEQVTFAFEHTLVNNTVLFVGTGLSEFQINNTFKKIRKFLDAHSTKHYIITDKKNLNADLREIVEPIIIDSFDELENVITQIMESNVETKISPPAISTPKIRISVFGHTNTGKTTLLRCLLKDRRVGLVEDVAGATTLSTPYYYNTLEIFDTPGFESAGNLSTLIEYFGEEKAKEELKVKRHVKELEILKNLQERNDVVFYVTTIDTVPDEGYSVELSLIKKYTKSIIAIINKANIYNMTTGFQKEVAENRISQWINFFNNQQIKCVLYDFHWDSPSKQNEIMDICYNLISDRKRYVFKRFLAEMNNTTKVRRTKITDRVKMAIDELNQVNKELLINKEEEYNSKQIINDLQNRCIYIYNKFMKDICNIYNVPTAEETNSILPSIKETQSIIAETKKTQPFDFEKILIPAAFAATQSTVSATGLAVSSMFSMPLIAAVCTATLLYIMVQKKGEKVYYKKIEYNLSDDSRFALYKSLLAIVWVVAYYGFEKNFNRVDFQQRLGYLIQNDIPDLLKKESVNVKNFYIKIPDILVKLGV